MTNDLDGPLGPEYARIARARKLLESAGEEVVRTAQAVTDFRSLGTEELPAAVAALRASEHADEDESAARWIDRTFTARSTDLGEAPAETLEFVTAVLRLRLTLHTLDQVLAAVPPETGGTPLA
ncbi:hypothetical protein AB0D86_28470 [Streptomyces sp. NPDC048324]|uniref:hypothetical protein n=1 Tax=Streptomyces sp. NPDC048324 TaxID=3157205 RepID=UPI00344654F5